MNRLSLLLVLTALSVLPVGAADAAKRKPVKKAPATHVYDVSWFATADIAFAGTTPGEIGESSSGSARLIMRGNVDRVKLRGNDVISSGKPRSRIHLEGRKVTDSWDAYSDSRTHTECAGTDEVSIAFGASAIANGDLVPLNGDALLVVRPFDEATFRIPCDSGGDDRWDLHAMSENDELGYGAWDAEFTLPKETIGMGKVIQKVASKPNRPVSCSVLMTAQETTECSLTWKTTITFRKRSARKRS
jgi:hypothetical protein